MIWRSLCTIMLLGTGVAAAQVTTTEEVLCRIPAERTSNFRLVSNHDLSKVAAMDVWGAEKKWYVALNNIVWEFYTALDPDSAQFSSDGKHFSLLAAHDGAWFLVTDDKDVRPLGKDPCRGLIFSADGNHDAYIQETAEGAMALLDGKPVLAGRKFDDISPLAWSADGSHFYFIATAENKSIAVLDGKVVGTQTADMTSLPVLSTDGKHVVWGVARQEPGGRQILGLADDQINARFHVAKAATEVTAIALSSDGNRLAWGEVDTDGTRVVVDGLPEQAMVRQVRHLSISPQGKVAYSGMNSRSQALVVVDQEPFSVEGANEQARMKFAPDELSLNVTTGKENLCFSRFAGHWVQGIHLAKVGNLKVEKYASNAYLNDARLDGTFLDARMTDDATAVILTEAPADMYVNEKQLQVVTRTVAKVTPQK